MENKVNKIIKRIRSWPLARVIKIVVVLWVLDYLILAGAVLFVMHTQNQMMQYQLHTDKSLIGAYQNEIIMQKEINALAKRIK